jgi:rRNA maturation endonuclease Nob1
MPVLDASAILNAFPFQFREGERLLTVPGVIDELKDLRSKAIAESGIQAGLLLVTSPSEKSLEKARNASKGLGLSGTDVEVLALAFEEHAELWTDDHGVQKAARKLGVKFEPIIHRPAR